MKVTRDQILAKAQEHFARAGIRKTSLSAIAADLGVVKGALYYHIPGGKQEMADACMRLIEDDFYRAMRRAADQQSSPAEALRSVVRAKLDVLTRLKGELGLSREVGEEVKTIMSSQQRDYHLREAGLFEEILARGQAEGIFRDVTSRREVARVIQAIVRHFELADVFAEREEDKTGELTLDLLLEGLRSR